MYKTEKLWGPKLIGNRPYCLNSAFAKNYCIFAFAFLHVAKYFPYAKLGRLGIPTGPALVGRLRLYEPAPRMISTHE